MSLNTVAALGMVMFFALLGARIYALHAEKMACIEAGIKGDGCNIGN